MLDHIFPATRAMAALRAGTVDFVAAAAHAVFADPNGTRILIALSQRTYWMLVVRADAPVTRGQQETLRNLRIAAAPGPNLALRCLLADWGIDLAERSLLIEPLPESYHPDESFGVRAARALSDHVIDALWANSMAAAIAVSMDVGRVVLDPRRGEGPAEASTYTFPALLTSTRMISERQADVGATARDVARVQRMLVGDPTLAAQVVDGLFPDREAALITDLIRRDAPFYDPAVDDAAIHGLNRFARKMALTTEDDAQYDVVARDAAGPWLA